LDRGTILLAVSGLGAVLFALCSISLFSLLVAGPAYDVTSRTVYRLRRDVLIPSQRQVIYPSSTYIAYPDFASLPRSNYTVTGSVSGNSSLAVLIFDSAGYTSYVGQVPSNPLVSVTSLSGENRTFQIHLDESRVLYLVISKQSGPYAAQVNLVIYYEYYEPVTETMSVPSIVKTVILPGAAVLGLVLLAYGFISLRGLAKKARESTESQLYMTHRTDPVSLG
jgi:hypothetical protein